tara:strand:+ start:544 stop:666 length:123 start_codon:yes stop_codon:yes gene_type:complete
MNDLDFLSSKDDDLLENFLNDEQFPAEEIDPETANLLRDF